MWERRQRLRPAQQAAEETHSGEQSRKRSRPARLGRLAQRIDEGDRVTGRFQRCSDVGDADGWNQVDAVISRTGDRRRPDQSDAGHVLPHVNRPMTGRSYL